MGPDIKSSPVSSVNPTFLGTFFRKPDRTLNTIVIVLAALAVIAFSGMAVSFYCCPENIFPGTSVYLVGAVALTGVGVLIARIFLAIQRIRHQKNSFTYM
jgi:hypothetical protein